MDEFTGSECEFTASGGEFTGSNHEFTTNDAEFTAHPQIQKSCPIFYFGQLSMLKS